MHALVISEQGVALHAEGEVLSLQRGKTVLRRVRVREIDQVVLLGRVEISCGAIGLLLRREIDLVLLTQQGRYRGRLSGRGSRNVQLRLAQYRRSTDPAFCARITRAIVAAKIRHQRQVLLRAQRRLKDERVAEVLGSLRLLEQRVAGSENLDVLRGWEGQAAALYFGQFGKLVRNDEFPFGGRSRRPPKDAINAMLSFGYAVLGSLIESDVYRCGLDPMLGFFHQPAYGRPSLMLDLIEEFRPLVDGLVLRLVNRRQVAAADFERRSGASLAEVLAGEEAPDEDLLPDEPDAEEGLPAEGAQPGSELAEPGAAAADAALAAEGGGNGGSPAMGVYLSDVGRKVFLNELFRRLRERMAYPGAEGACELRDIVRQQAYQLARVILGKAEAYEPFVPS